MHSLTTTGALLLLFQTLQAWAAPTSTTIKVVYRMLETGSQHGIAAFDDAGNLLGSGCDHALDTGAFSALPISISVGSASSADGTISVAGKSFNLQSNPSDPSQPTCHRAYGGGVIEVDCTVAVPADLTTTSAKATASNSCFPGSLAHHPLHEGKLLMLSHSNASMSPASQKARSVSPRSPPSGTLQARQCATVWTTQLVGDGNPHQNYFDKQVSNNMNCGAAPACSVDNSQSTSWTFGVDASFTFDEWLTGGFSVSYSTSIGEDRLCQGSTGETVCIWYSKAYTAYTAQNVLQSCCSNGYCNNDAYGDTGVIFSPNAGDVGSLGYYCVVGPCRSLGQGYWDYNGRAGGP